MFFIWSIDHHKWWRPNHVGYTECIHEAGEYNIVEANDIIDRANVISIHECAIPAGSTKAEKIGESLVNFDA